jgi:hypothetical protein
VKRKRLVWAGGILAGLLVGLPLLLWGGYAVLALLRQEHFYHGMPSSYWRQKIRRWRGPRTFPPDKPLPIPTLRRAADFFGLDVEGIPGSNPNPADFRSNPAAVPVLTDLIWDPDPGIQDQAFMILGGMGPSAAGAVPALATALRSGAAHVSAHAIQALRLIGEGGATALVVDALADDREAIRQAAVYLLTYG